MTTAEKVLSVLESYSLKPAGTGKYRANSPLRPGSNSHAFSLVVEADGEHGGYYDHVSKDKGSLYELAELLNIEVPRRTVENTKRAYKDLEDYAAAHGVESSVLAAAGWQQTTHGGRLALSFPTQNGTRYRFLDDQKPTYINEVGYKSCWYGLSRAVDMARKVGEALILCNGEISTVVAQHYGLPACCVTSGEKRIPDPLVDTLKAAWNGEVWLALDCDSAGRAAMREIAQQLPSAKLLDLGLSTGGDLADFCRLYGQEVSSALAKCIVPEIRDEEISPTPAYTSDDEALEIYIRELNGELVPEAQPLINPFNFLHAVGGLGHVIPPGKLLYFVSVSGGTKTIAFETGWQRYQRDGIHSIVYSPEWVDDRGAVEMAARAVQRAGGASFTDRMLHSLWQIEQHNRIENGHGVQMPSSEVSRSIARAEMLKRVTVGPPGV